MSVQNFSFLTLYVNLEELITSTMLNAAQLTSYPSICNCTKNKKKNKIKITHTTKNVAIQNACSQRQCYWKTQILHTSYVMLKLYSRCLSSMRRTDWWDLRRWACILHWLWQQCCPVWVPAWSRRCMWRCIWPTDSRESDALIWVILMEHFLLIVRLNSLGKHFAFYC